MSRVLVVANETVEAEELLAESSGVGIFDEARLYDLKASLRRDQRRWTEALELHDRVIGIYQSLGQRHLLGRDVLGRGGPRPGR